MCLRGSSQAVTPTHPPRAALTRHWEVHTGRSFPYNSGGQWTDQLSPAGEAVFVGGTPQLCSRPPQAPAPGRSWETATWALGQVNSEPSHLMCLHPWTSGFTVALRSQPPPSFSPHCNVHVETLSHITSSNIFCQRPTCLQEVKPVKPGGEHR